MLIATLLALAALEPDGPACAPEEHTQSVQEAGISVRNPLFCFDYSWPAEAGAVPALRQIMHERAIEEQADLVVQAAADRAERLADDPAYSFMPYSYQTAYSLSADTHALLALEGTTETYTGGAHGGLTHSVFYWDKGSAREIEFGDLFDDAPAAYALLEAPFCAALRAQQIERAGGRDASFWACPPLEEQPIALVAGDGGRIGTLNVLLAPYVAGPWAEGPYYVELPVTPDFARLLRPAYRDSFDAR